MPTTQQVQTITLDTSQQAKMCDDPYWITYKCPRCGEFKDDTTPHSHWNGERWVRMHYCWDCIEAAL